MRDKRRDPAHIRDDFRLAIRNCISGRSPWPLTFIGPAGCGKTCAALCLYDRIAHRSIFNANQFFSFAQLCERYASAMFGRLTLDGHRDAPIVDATEFWALWRNASACFIDDVGVRERISEHAYETFKRALDTREGDVLVITSNLTIGQIANVFDDRIASRLSGGTVVDVTDENAVDMRLRKDA